MDKNIESYIKIYNAIDKDLCKSSIEQLEEQNWEKHLFYDSKVRIASAKSGDKELDIFFGEIGNKEILSDLTWKSIFSYVESLNFSWYRSWNGFSSIRFNRYEKDQTMAIHCDHIYSLFDGNRKGVPILSIVGLLNDDYTGGEFIMFEDKEIKLSAGDIMIFPSNFLYPHKVEPVKEGKRYSFVSWVF